MGRPTSKPELLAAAEQEFDRLWDAVRAESPSDRETPGASYSSSVNDNLADLDASDDDLFAKRRYRWTGSTSVGSYAVSATSSHDAWASGLIRRWLRSPT